MMDRIAALAALADIVPPTPVPPPAAPWWLALPVLLGAAVALFATLGAWYALHPRRRARAALRRLRGAALTATAADAGGLALRAAACVRAAGIDRATLAPALRARLDAACFTAAPDAAQLPALIDELDALLRRRGKAAST